GIMFMSEDNGDTWEDVNFQDAFYTDQVKAIKYFNGYLYVAVMKGTSGKISRRPFSGCMNVEENKPLSFDVYPNPTKESVTISNLPTDSTLKIVDITGKILYSSVIKDEQTTINTSNFVNGIYIMHIENSGNIANKKLVIKK